MYDFTDDHLEKKGLKHLKMGLTKDDLSWAIYPEDSEIFQVGVRGIYAQNYAHIGMEIKMQKYPLNFMVGENIQKIFKELIEKYQI